MTTSSCVQLVVEYFYMVDVNILFSELNNTYFTRQIF